MTGRTANLFFPAAPPARLRGWKRVAAGALRRIGPTWRAAPVRRIVQVTCLLLFLHLFLYVAWPYATRFSSRTIADKQWMPLEAFLWIDPLVGISTAIAARAWNVACWGTAAILLACVLAPRAFCGYLCPLGTLIDAFDWSIGRPARWLARRAARHFSRPGRPPRPRPARVPLDLAAADPPHPHPWWVHLRYFLLAAVLVASAAGILLAGYVAAIPVLTRGLMFSAGRGQLGLLRNWSQVAPADAAVYLSLSQFAAVFLLGLIRPRFWCRYVCPSGAVFSLGNLLRVGERKVESSCTRCNKCVTACPFDAIREDFTTRTADCTFCQTCGGACPTGSIKFVTRWNATDLKPPGDPPVALRPLSRRGLVLSAVGGALAAVATHTGPARALPAAAAGRPLRPPGSVPEDEFLDLCIRCGECFKVCPGPVLHPAGFTDGLEGLWAPVVLPTHAGCHQDCNFCTTVCPTGAIAPLALARKRATPMGLAAIDATACLPHQGKQDCRLCYDECTAAGYHAIEMRPIRIEVGDIPEGAVSEQEREEMGRIAAPFVRTDLCVGCGLCEYRCNAALVKQRPLLQRSAITVLAEDRRRPRAIHTPPGSAAPVP